MVCWVQTFNDMVSLRSSMAQDVFKRVLRQIWMHFSCVPELSDPWKWKCAYASYGSAWIITRVLDPHISGYFDC